jgi:hypothetical protein
MRLPDFLIIGAAKAGTTSLYRDLRCNPQIFMPRDKEAGNLKGDDVLTPRGRRAYARLFATARPDQVCGEAPTDYTKLPQFPGVPQRALDVIGPRVKAVYLVREPVARIISFHHHQYVEDKMPADINAAVREFPELLDHTRYAMQITPWLETFGPEQVVIVRFEDYVADRPSTVATLSRFLGVAPRPDLVRTSTIYNPGTGRPVLRGPTAYLRRNPVYERLVRPLLPLTARDALRRFVLPKAPPRTAPPSLETVDSILEHLADDLDQLQRLMARSEPPWDFQAVRQRYSPAADPRPAGD